MDHALLPIPTERVDERDTMFARAALVDGSPTAEAYYARRPEYREVDASLRALTPLCAPGSAFYDSTVMGEAIGHFEAIDHLNVEPAWIEATLPRLRAAADAGRFLKQLALELGAVAAGWAALDQAFVFTHKGRFPEDHGRPVELDHPRVLVFLVEMHREEMLKAPKAPTLRESAHQYFRAARISFHLEALLKAAGYVAKQHYDAHYDVILPPLAVAAGLGELGRNNILLAERFGSRVRIGCVTTDAPATLDAPRSLGARAFCTVCKKCAENCPGRALSLGAPVSVRGVEKWPTEVEKCYRYWRQVGTDCGVCMVCCPFSHEDNALHNAVRWMVKHLPWSHRFLVRCDDLIYGRKWRSRG